MEHAIDTELPLYNLRCGRTIQTVSGHQALDTVDVHEDFDRFFHYLSRFGLVSLPV
jgi:hypothetical protein